MPENQRLQQFISKADSTMLPVLPHTLQSLKTALEKPSFNYHQLDTILQYDPACMINLLAYANREINKEFDREISQVEHAAMFLGMERLEQFIAKISSLYNIANKKIADKLARLQHRGVHAAFQAYNFAHLINDSTPNEVYTSTLLTPLSELVCWFLEPIKAQQVELLVYQKGSDYKQAQEKIFGFSYHDLAEALTHQWHIPHLFLQRQEMDALDDSSKSLKCMYLAEKCSILAESGWYYEAMYEQIALCSEQLHYSEERITQEVHKTAIDMAHSAQEFYPIQDTSSYLALLPGKVPYTQVIAIEEKKSIPKKAAKKAPQRTKTPSIQLIPSTNDFPSLIRLTVEALFETNIFSRVAFIMLSKDKKTLQVRSLKEHKLANAHSKVFITTLLSMQPANLFSKLLVKPQTVFINTLNYQKFSPIISADMKKMLDTQEFAAKSVHVNGKPIGLFYIDKHPLEDGIEHTLETTDFNHFKHICALFEKQLKQLS